MQRTNDSVRKVLECVTLKGVLEHERGPPGDRRRQRRHPRVRHAWLRRVARLRRAADGARGLPGHRQPFEFLAFFDLGGSALAADRAQPDDVRRGHRLRGHVRTPSRATSPRWSRPSTSRSGRATPRRAGARRPTSRASPPATSRCIQRGTCTFEIKAENAAAAGAGGIIFFNQGDTADPARQGIPAVTLGNGYTGDIPALNADLRPRRPAGADHQAWRCGCSPTSSARVGDHREPHRRVQARRPGQRGDGRGPPRLRLRGTGHQRQRLRLQRAARGRRAAGQVRHDQQAAVRVVVGAEEASLVGSTYYVSQLSARRARRPSRCT